MNFLTFISLWILLLCSISHIYPLGIGKVYIGFLENSSLSQNNSISWQPSLSSSSYYIPVYIQVFENGNLSQPLPFAANVTIDCETDRNSNGYSVVSFSSLTLSEGVQDGTIAVSLIKPGRAVNIRCFGISALYTANETECVNMTQQFTKETSISPPWRLIVLPKLMVSICNSPIAVRGANGSFRVEFSTYVKNFPVAVSCNPVDSAVTELVIYDVNVTMISASTRMKYSVVNGTLTSPVKVTCTVQYFKENQLITSQAGNPGWFVPDEVNVDLIPSTLQVNGLTFEAFLVAKGISGQDIRIQCFTKTVKSHEEATAFVNSISCPEKNTAINSVNQTTTPATSSSTTQTKIPASLLPTTRTASTINLMNQWLINNPNLTLKAEGVALKLSRKLPVEVLTLELVVLTCCASISLGGQFLRQNKLNLTATVSLQPSVFYNQTKLIPIDEIGPTPVGNPAKENFANCPCDMTWNNCDINCCCDMDCSPSDIDTFEKCIPGYEGAQPVPPPGWMCDSTYHTKLKTFLCVVTQDSAFLGLYRRDKSSISRSVIFRMKWNPKSYSFSKAVTSNSATDQDFNYKHGSQINTYIPDTVNRAPKVLTLPQRIFSGQCAITAPVRFLTETNSDCIYQMTPDLCSDNSILSATSFVLSSVQNNPSCPTAYTIHNELEQTIAETDVSYFCTSKPERYLKSLDTLSDVLAHGLESFENFTIPEDCTIGNDGLYNCPDNMEESLFARDEDLPPRCVWDDGFTRSDAPRLRENSNGYQCDNVVLSVRYQITWSGNKIEFLNASVILGNVSLFTVKEKKTLIYYSENVTDPSTNLTDTVSRILIRNTTVNETTQLNPHYEVRYKHIFNKSLDDRHYYGLPRERSGYPGYDFGKPIWSGTAVLDKKRKRLLYVNQNRTQQMSVWEPSPSGLCSLAGKRKITFGEDLFSSCFVPLKLDSLNDCQNLRKWLFYRLSLLMPSNRIGRYGSNRANNRSDWIKVFRENLTAKTSECNDTIPTMDHSSTSSGITLPFTTEPTLSNNKSESPEGTCNQIPVGIALNIMYAHTGLVHGAPIKEIIGARASYVYDNWTFTCVDEVIGGSCVFPSRNNNDTDPESTERYQLFTLSSEVQFTLVPAARPKPVIRFHQHAALNKSSLTFWDRMLNPIYKQPGEETESYMNRTAVSLILFFVTIVYIIILNVL